MGACRPSRICDDLTVVKLSIPRPYDRICATIPDTAHGEACIDGRVFAHDCVIHKDFFCEGLIVSCRNVNGRVRGVMTQSQPGTKTYTRKARGHKLC
eukprot:scaffold38273_cov28-Tisochrysis_lutea.AAC.2